MVASSIGYASRRQPDQAPKAATPGRPHSVIAVEAVVATFGDDNATSGTAPGRRAPGDAGQTGPCPRRPSPEESRDESSYLEPGDHNFFHTCNGTPRNDIRNDNIYAVPRIAVVLAEVDDAQRRGEFEFEDGHRPSPEQGQQQPRAGLFLFEDSEVILPMTRRASVNTPRPRPCSAPPLSYRIGHIEDTVVGVDHWVAKAPPPPHTTPLEWDEDVSALMMTDTGGLAERPLPPKRPLAPSHHILNSASITTSGSLASGPSLVSSATNQQNPAMQFDARRWWDAPVDTSATPSTVATATNSRMPTLNRPMNFKQHGGGAAAPADVTTAKLLAPYATPPSDAEHKTLDRDTTQRSPAPTEQPSNAVAAPTIASAEAVSTREEPPPSKRRTSVKTLVLDFLALALAKRRTRSVTC